MSCTQGKSLALAGVAAVKSQTTIAGGHKHRTCGSAVFACIVLVVPCLASAQNAAEPTEFSGDQRVSEQPDGARGSKTQVKSATVIRSADEGDDDLRPSEGRPTLTYHVDRPEDSSPDKNNAQHTLPPPIDNIATSDLLENSFGTKGSIAFAGITGTGVTGASTQSSQGGIILGGAPIDRLTVHGFVGRDDAGHLAPSVTLHLRFLGDYKRGYALGTLARYKTEGFADAHGESELGLTAALRRGRLHLDTNIVGGLGVEESELGEVDGELRFRIGYDVFSNFRLGSLWQYRKRLAGDRALAGGRTWDTLGGGAVSAWYDRFLVSINGGPSTVGVATGVAAYGMVTVAVLSSY